MRDFGLMLAALTLTRLASVYDPPFGRAGDEQALANLAEAKESGRTQLEGQLGSTRTEIARVENKLERYFQAFWLLIKDIQVHDRRRIIPTYRIPTAVRATPRKVELGGLEPPTSWVRSRRSPS